MSEWYWEGVFDHPDKALKFLDEKKDNVSLEEVKQIKKDFPWNEDIANKVTAIICTRVMKWPRSL